MLNVAVAWSSSDKSAIHYVFPFLWMMSCLTIMNQTKAMLLWYILKSDLPGTELGGKV